jgi:hypothetical protein
MDAKLLRQWFWPLACAGALGACGGGASVDAGPAGSAPLRSASVVEEPLGGQLIDVYDAQTNILTIPLVQVGVGFYKDVQVEVAAVLSLGTDSATSGAFDFFDQFKTGNLTIPVVRVASTLYRNVRISLGNLVAIGPYVDRYSVPLDLAQVTYPASYQTITTNAADINSDPCNLNLTAATYPATWIGQYPLPAINGAPLKPATKRSVSLKDIGLNPPNNPAFILPGATGAPAGCTGSLQSELAKTVDRLKNLGTEYVTITQWHWATNRPDGSWYFTKAEDTFGSITDADLSLFMQKAHAAGLKVIMKNQIQAFRDSGDTSGNSYIPAATQANYQKWFAAYQEYILERSVFFQSIGVDVWEAGCTACIYRDSGTDSPADRALFASQIQTALNNMKLVFTGQTLMSTNSWLHNTPALASRIDIFEIGLWGITVPPDANLTVAAYKAAIATWGLQFAVNQYDGYHKAIKVDYGIQSRKNVFAQWGYMEETSCTAAVGDFNGTADTCIQRETSPDFSVQAIVHEAMLESLNQLTMTSTLIVGVSDYWETDSLMPFTAFPNLAFSIRNKPAEGIVKAWFAR